MLTKPESGWTIFNLESSKSYCLNYLDDIAFEWLDQAIHGLETMSPFCVKGFLEPNRFLCTVSYWNCHIIIEDDERYPLESEDIINKTSLTSMIEFCKYLYEDINLNIEEWVHFMDYVDYDVEERKNTLIKKLGRFKALILEKEEYFGDNHCFL